MTKFLSKDWMIENKFLPLDEYNDPNHPLANTSFDDLFKTIKPIEYFNSSLTVGSALALLGNGKIDALPIVDDN